MHQTQLVDALEVGRALSVTAETVLRRFRDGRLPGYAFGARIIRFDLAEVLQAARREAAAQLKAEAVAS